MSEKQKFERIVQKYCKRPFRVFTEENGKMIMKVMPLSEFYGFEIKDVTTDVPAMMFINAHPEHNNVERIKFWEEFPIYSANVLESHILFFISFCFRGGERSHVENLADAKGLINACYRINSITKENRDELLNQLKTCKLTK